METTKFYLVREDSAFYKRYHGGGGFMAGIMYVKQYVEISKLQLNYKI